MSRQEVSTVNRCLMISFSIGLALAGLLVLNEPAGTVRSTALFGALGVVAFSTVMIFAILNIVVLGYRKIRRRF